MADGKEKNAGKVHGTSAQEPECQHGKGKRRGDHECDKPDFDEKDANISPRRKAPGPGKPDGNRSDLPAQNPARPGHGQPVKKAPQAKIEEDLPPESGQES